MKDKRPLPYRRKWQPVMARCLNPAYPCIERPWYECRWLIAMSFTDDEGTFDEQLRKGERWVGPIEYTLLKDLSPKQIARFGWDDKDCYGPGHAIAGQTNWHEDPAQRGDEKLAKRTARAHSDAEFLKRCAADPDLLAFHSTGPRPVVRNPDGTASFASPRPIP